MADTAYILTGTAMLLGVLVWSRYASRAFLSPYAIYMIILFVHMFPDPVVRRGAGFISDQSRLMPGKCRRR